MANIFWVEDQYHWIDKFKPVLESADFGDGSAQNSVTVHRFVASACQAVNGSPSIPDVAILDANMNGNDDAGLRISRLIAKKWPQIPVLYLSEHSGTDIEEKAFEETHPRDFIAKHQHNVEKILCWRIRAVLRHETMQNSASSRTTEQVITRGDLSIDLTTWNVYWFGERLMNPANNKRPLAPMPRKILRTLVEASPHPLSTLQISERLDLDIFNYANYRQHIKILRHAFEQACQRKQLDSFLEYCKSGKGIVTFGDKGAYAWVTKKKLE